MLMDQIDALYTRIIGPDIEHYHGSQRKAEFSECIDHLHRSVQAIAEREVRFLEIGAYKGLWALALKVLCEASGKAPHYVTATWVSQDPNNQDLFRTRQHYRDAGLDFTLIDADSTTAQTAAAVRACHASYHFVLIDGDHRLKAVTADIGHYGPLASHRLIFHDINTRACGVRRAIESAGIFLNLQIAYGIDMGIGISDRTVPAPAASRRRWFR